MPPGYQTNAADPRQVRSAERIARRRAARERDYLRAIMRTEDGRGFIWTQLAPIHRSSWARDASIHFNEGIRNVALELEAALLGSDDEEMFDLYQTMEREQRAIARREQHEADAARIPHTETK